MTAALVTSLLWLLVVTSSGASVPAVNSTGNDVSYPASSSMPAGWESMCSVTSPSGGSRVIRCHVTENGVWEFGAFRNWTQGLEAGHVVDLEVTCSRDGAISLPWPYRAPNLRSLTVRSCTLLGWLEESSRPGMLASLEDGLQRLRMEDNVAQVRLTSLVLLLRNASQEFDCGPQHLTSYRQSGMTYGFELDRDLTEQQTMALMTEYLQANRSSSHTCRYDNLETYEETRLTSSNVYSMYLLSHNAQMPRLRHVSLSQTRQTAVPSLLFHWHQQFPRLQTLNLSRNLITNFSLEMFAYMGEGHIDLTYNNITTLTKQELESMTQVNNVKVDVRHNPFVCACSTADFSDFLFNYDGPEAAGLDPYYAYLWDLTCAAPADKQGRKLSEFSKDHLCHLQVGSVIGDGETQLGKSGGDSRLLLLLLPLVGLGLALYLGFWLDVHVFLHSRLGRCRGGKHAQPAMDVFVSYGQHDSDAEFVLKDLRPRLEAEGDKGRQKYKLCLECRQSEVTKDVQTKMADSRAVVMVLSRDMPVDGWAEFEFQEALFRAVSERRPLLVFLQRGNLDTRVLSPALRRALNLFPLIKVGERQCWDKLDYFLQRGPASLGVGGRPCRPCPLSRQLGGAELGEVARLAQAHLQRGRQTAASKPAPPLDPAMMA